MAQDEYFVTGRKSAVARKAGASARSKAAKTRDAAPIRSALGRILGVHTEERAWRRGADGEERVGAALRRLPEGWHVFHDITVSRRGANIDHVVIGPGGVYSINTKNLTGNVWVAERALLVNGKKTSYLRDAAREAEIVSKRLSSALGRPIFATPVLAIFAERITVKSPPVVAVVEAKLLRRWLERRPTVLSQAEAFAVAKGADDPATWAL